MDYLVYLLVLGLLAILGRLPLVIVFRLGSAFGFLAWCILPNYRRLAHHNITIAFGDSKSPKEISRIVRQHFQNLGANILTTPRLAKMSESAVFAHVKTTGLEHIHNALKNNRGVVVAINHIGNWELYALLVGKVKGVQVGAIFQSQRNKYLNRLIDKTRKRLGLLTFDRRKGYLDAANLVESGGILSILIDQHAGDGGIWTPLFRRLASTSPLAPIIAQRTKAPLISVAIYTVGVARWHCVVEPALDPANHSVEELSYLLNHALEKEIATSPPDWFWVHNRWKTTASYILGDTRRGFYLPPSLPASSLQQFRLLVRSSNWLGDAVMNIPAVQACKAGRPDLHLTILCPAKLADLWRRVPEVDEVIEIQPGENPWQLGRRIRKHWDAAILFPNSLRSALEARALRIPRIDGFPGHNRRRLISRVPKFSPESCGHHANRYMRLVRNFGAPKNNNKPPTFLQKSSRSQPIHPPRIGVCPGAEYGPAKRYPADRFATAMSLFHAQTPAEWLLFGVKSDTPAGAEISNLCNFEIQNRIGKTSLNELFDELSSCDMLLTNDTGTMHLAAFLGIPTVAIFGSTEPALTSPLGDFHEILRYKVDCSPCFLRECPIDFRCMMRIEPIEATMAMRRIWERLNATA